jgi:hypothetical protein
MPALPTLLELTSIVGKVNVLSCATLCAPAGFANSTTSTRAVPDSRS